MYTFQASIGFRVASRAACFIEILNEYQNLGSVARDYTDKSFLKDLLVVTHPHTNKCNT